MSAWIPALMAATESNHKLRKPIVFAWPPIALDDADITVEELMMSGTSIIIAKVARDARRPGILLMMTVLDSERRLPDPGWPEPVEPIERCGQSSCANAQASSPDWRSGGERTPAGRRS